jgi:8-amino-3,8-dideoxy-alpha-D-manno-octulosonate transaminase
MPDNPNPVRTEPWPYGGFGVNLIGEEELSEVEEVVKSKSLFRFYGPDPKNKADAFEAEYSNYVGTTRSLGVSSGTAAVHLGVAACGIGPGEEVIVPPLTFIANISPVLLCGGIPVFADIDPGSLNLDPDSVREAVTSKTKAILPVHLLGFPADMDGLGEVAEENDLFLIEDASHAHGSALGGRKVGSLGDIGCFSLQLNKMMTCGEGGVITTSDDEIYDNAVRYHDHGFNRFSEEKGGPLGLNYRMSELQAAVALAQLRKLDRIVEIVNTNAAYVNPRMEQLGLIPRKVIPGSSPVHYYMVFHLPDDLEIDAPQLSELIREQGVPAGQIYGGQPAYELELFKTRKTINRAGWPFSSPLNSFGEINRCPVLERALTRFFTLPNSTNLTQRELEDMVAATEVALRKARAKR